MLKTDVGLAIVLAHEIAHAYRIHMAYLRAKQAVGILHGIPATIFGGQVASQLVSLLVGAATTKFDRHQEREADVFGLMWVHKSGFDPGMPKTNSAEWPSNCSKAPKKNSSRLIPPPQNDSYPWNELPRLSNKGTSRPKYSPRKNQTKVA